MTSKGPRKRAYKKDPRLIETLPWQCQSTKPNDGQLVDQRPVGEVSLMKTYLGQVSTQKQGKVQSTKATNDQSIDQRPVDGDPSMVAYNTALRLFYLRGDWEIHPMS